MAWLEVDYFNNLGPIDSRITILLTVLGCLLLGALIVYLISAIRNRGKPKPERHGTGNLGGLGGYSGRGVGVGGPPNSSPGAFALYGRNKGDSPSDEDPRTR